ncbi:aminoglycoside phosphotransferase family protein [Nocardia sp. AG03]|uniref:aminoglycoside phosphotransferase family protein n=1 Tax=Nocardia sp. AG03 TaxID=3025312 RepID=UPI00241839B8|nr:aminoglycoside phosphotransferase family protein [Nocardia sp. AG03]
MITVPTEFADKKQYSASESGRRWIAALPGIVAELMDRWSCVPDGAIRYGEVGLVVPVRHRDLPPAVVKVSFPHPGNVHEPDAYTAWRGSGAVHLYARADEHFAMLLERAHDTLATVTDDDAALTIQGTLTRTLAVPAPAELPRLADRMDEWESEMIATAARFGDPIPRPVFDAALATLHELGRDQPALLVHGDLHDANVLAGHRAPWLAIDPKCLVGDPAYDALNVIRSPRFAPLLLSPNPKQRLLRCIDVYSDAAELDPVRARRWIQAGSVKEALWGREHGDPDWLVQATEWLATALTEGQ